MSPLSDTLMSSSAHAYSLNYVRVHTCGIISTWGAYHWHLAGTEQPFTSYWVHQPWLTYVLQVGTCAAVNMMGMPYKLYQSPRYRLIVDGEVVEE